MKKLIIMNFSGVYELEKFADNPSAVHIDCTHLTGTDCYCDQEAEQKIRSLIAPYPAEGIHFIDSGDYHYITEFWTDKLSGPFNLVLFDHHTDMQPPLFEGLLSCGSWVESMLEHNPQLRKVVLFGIPEAQKRTIPSKFQDRVITYTDIQLHRHLQESRPLCLQEPIYISVDKDVLDTRSAATNWDQGILSLSELKQLLTLLLRHEKVLGVDICGECTDTIHQLSMDPAIQLDNEANSELLTLLSQLSDNLCINKDIPASSIHTDQRANDTDRSRHIMQGSTIHPFHAGD